jgi:ribosome-associated protein
MIRITPAISIDEREIEESFVRSSGPGGQNVNKLSTAVQLRFDVRGSPSLERLVALIRQAAVRPVPRRATKPTRASKEKRLEGKKVRSRIKGLRRSKPVLD